MYIRVTSCDKCGGGNNTPCKAEYTDGSNYCFSCHNYTPASGHMSFAIRDSRTVKDLSIPDNIEFNPKKFNTDNLKWLLKYYLNDSMIKQNHIGQLDTGELFFPILNSIEEIYFYQTRSIDKRFRTYGNKNSLHIIPTKFENPSTFIIVEDYISAVRCSQFSNVICLFGTSISRRCLYQLCDLPETSVIIVWLDGDKPGIEASHNICSKIYSLIQEYQEKFPFTKIDLKCRQVVTPKDPKSYSTTAMYNILRGD